MVFAIGFLMLLGRWCDARSEDVTCLKWERHSLGEYDAAAIGL